jgi:flagellar biogenesis protein FliO
VATAIGVVTGGAGTAHPTVMPRIAATEARTMWVIIVELLLALALLLFIVWWTMFAGRSRGERRDRDDA